MPRKLFLILGMSWIYACSVSTVYAVTLKIATLAPDGTTWMREMRDGAEQIATRTNGRVKLRFYPGGVMGNDKSVLRKMRIGQLHGAAFSSGELANIYSGAQIYSLPFLFRTYGEVDYVRERMDRLIKQKLEQEGFITLGISEGGFAYMMSDKPLLKVDDLHDRRVWIPEGDVISQAMFKTAGISPIPLPIADVYTGLQTGLIDTVANTAVGAIAFQWHTKMNHVTDTPMLLVVGMLVIDKKTYEKIKQADREILSTIMQSVFKRLDKANREDDANARQALIEQGVSFNNPSPEEVNHWREIADKALVELGNEGSYPREMLEILQGHLKDYRHSKQTSDAR